MIMATTKSILNHINTDLLNANKENIKDIYRLSSGVKRNEKPRIYLHIQTSRRDLFVKYSQKEKRKVFESEYGALQEVQRNGGFEVPRPIGLFNNGVLLSRVDGYPLELLLKKQGLNAKNLKILATVLNRIALFHSLNTQPDQTIAIALYKKISGKKMPTDIEPALKKAHLGFTHGDLDPFNILIRNDNSKFRFGLIDWEDFLKVGIQELDVLHFVIMTGLIISGDHNSASNNKKLYHLIFDNYKNNPYLRLLSIYCRKRNIAVDNIFRLIPTYCDVQNYRLSKAGRDESKFLYSDFKREYYETK